MLLNSICYCSWVTVISSVGNSRQKATKQKAVICWSCSLLCLVMSRILVNGSILKSTHCCSSVRHSECAHSHLSNHMPLSKTSLSPIFHSSSVLMNWSDIGYFPGIYIHSHLSTLLLYKVNEQGHCLHSHQFEMIFPLHLLWLYRVVYGYTVQVLLYIFGFIYILILYRDRGWKN